MRDGLVRLEGRLRDERDECCDPLLICQMGLGPGKRGLVVGLWGFLSTAAVGHSLIADVHTPRQRGG